MHFDAYGVSVQKPEGSRPLGKGAIARSRIILK
jgi:hypothetical protein